MNFLGWNLVLFASKWVLIALIYGVLLVLLFSVRRELSLRLGKGQPKASSATGRLRVLNPGQDPRLFAGAVLNLRADTCLGAAPDSDVLLNDPFISAHHARLTWDGAAWWVEDLESRNGTLVGGSPCLSHTPHPLRPGVPLQLGDITFELVEVEILKIILRRGRTPVRFFEGTALFLVLLAALLGFASATAAGLLREGGGSNASLASALARAVPIPVLAVLAFVLVHLVLRLRGQEAEEAILPVVALLTVIGLVMIWRLRGPAGTLQQARSLVPGLGVTAALIARPRWTDAIRRWAVPISLIGLGLSFLTAFFGVQDESGARLALKLGPLPSIQTTEFIKVALIIFLAWFADKEVRAVEGRSRLVLGWLRMPPLRYFLPGAVFVATATLALALMSDYGAVLILLILFLGVLYSAFETRIFATLAGLGALMAVPVGLALALVWRVPDVMRYRFLAFLDPWSSQPVILNGQAMGFTISEGPGYQIQQAIYAIAAGGITGKGLGFGSPGFIPLAHSDFIFASILEELGAVTGLAVLALYGVLLMRIFRTAALLPAGQVFERILVTGIGIHLVTQVLVMVGGTLNLLPMTGVTLPFLSQGGTAFMVNLIEVGVVLSLLQRVEVRPV